MKYIGNAFNIYLIWTNRLSYLLKHLRITIKLHILASFQTNEIDKCELNFYRYAYSGLKFTRVLPKDMKNL